MRKQRPVLGIISGLVFGVFLTADLALFGVVPLDSVVLTIVPVAGLVLGGVLGFRPWARGERRKDVVPPEAAAEAVSGDAPAAVTAEATPPPADEPAAPPPGDAGEANEDES